jgi:predicted S18 family serine protease
MNNEEERIMTDEDFAKSTHEHLIRAQPHYEKVVTWLLSEKDAEIERLKEELALKDAAISDLCDEVNAKNEEIQQLKEELRESKKREFYCHETDSPTCEHQCANCTSWYTSVLSKCDPSFKSIYQLEKEIHRLKEDRAKIAAEAWDAAEEWLWAKGTHSEKYTTTKAEYLKQFQP